MATNAYTLDRNKARIALDVLRREAEVVGPLLDFQRSRETRRLRRLALFSFAMWVVCVALLHQWIPRRLVLVAMAVPLMVFGLVEAPLFVREIGLVRKARRTQKHLGIEKLPWVRFVSRKELKARLRLAIPYAIGGSTMIVGVVLFVLVDQDPLFLDVGCGAFLAGFLALLRRVVPRNREVIFGPFREGLKLVPRLESFANSDPEASTSLELSEAEYERLARIERALANLSRVESIERQTGQDLRKAYAVAHDASALAERSSLDVDHQLLLQARIDQLCLDPRSPPAQEDVDGRYHLLVPDVGVDIVYSVREAAGRIEVHHYEQAAGGHADPHGSPPGEEA